MAFRFFVSRSITVTASVLACAVASPQCAAAPSEVDGKFSHQLSAYFDTYCIDCHGADEQMAGITVNSVGSREDVLKNGKSWSRVLKMIRLGAMPPEDIEPRPTTKESRSVAELLEDALSSIDCRQLAQPGYPTVRRLNRVEYNNTIRDLFGVHLTPADDFPSDDVGEGFDNIGGVLSVSPLLLEKYLSAAEQVTAGILENTDDSDTSRNLFAVSANDQTSVHQAAIKFVRPLLPRVFRRTVTEAEIERFAGFTELMIQDQTVTWEQAVAATVQAMLVSPEFLFRLEQDPADSEPEYQLNAHELANRLSYFLWSSMPDEELFGVAEEERLHEPHMLATQIERMIQDDRSMALVNNFAAQWLNLRLLEEAHPDGRVFDSFDEDLRRAMLQETSLVFRRIMIEDRSVDELLIGQFTFVNEKLAVHYGIDGIVGDEFVLVSLENSPRCGILTHASILTLTSYPRRTSPVQRGKWILKNLLGDAPPPPPPDIPELNESAKEHPERSVREQMAVHRRNPVCASCHQVMDPLGLGLENFDGIGRWRDEEQGRTIDSRGELPGGKKFENPQQLAEILLSRQDGFVRTLVQKMLIYATGRGLEYYDRCVVDDCVEYMDRHDNRFSSLVRSIVQSDAFMKRGRPEP